MPEKPTKAEIEAAFALAEQYGHEYGKQLVTVTKTVTKTLDIDESLWQRVNTLRASQEITIRACIGEALTLWLKKHEGEET